MHRTPAVRFLLRCAATSLWAFALIGADASCATSRPPWMLDGRPELSGKIRLDGRNLGRHETYDWLCKPLSDGSVDVLGFLGQVTSPHGHVPVVHMRVGPDSSARGLDVQLPWSHVVFLQNECTRFEVEFTPEPHDAPPTWRRASVHATCALPGTDDHLEADVNVDYCEY